MITRSSLIRQELFINERQFIDTSQDLRRQQYCLTVQGGPKNGAILIF